MGTVTSSTSHKPCVHVCIWAFNSSTDIQIVSVKQVASERPEFMGKDVPSEITSFYSNNEIDTFQFDRPYHREGKDKNNEFKVYISWNYIGHIEQIGIIM